MRLPALRSIAHQSAYPSQAEGGFAGELHKSVRAALNAWEKRRHGDTEFRYGRGNGLFRREKTATASRDEISWNEAPEVKRPSKKRVYVKKEPKARKGNYLEQQREYMRQRRANMTPEQRAVYLAQKRERYRRSVGGQLKNRKPAMTPEERQRRKNEINAACRARVKAGLRAPSPSKMSEKRREYLKRWKANLTPEQLETHLRKKRERYLRNAPPRKPKRTPEQKREQKLAASKAYRERVRQGLQAPAPSSSKSKAKEYRDRHKAKRNSTK